MMAYWDLGIGGQGKSREESTSDTSGLEAARATFACCAFLSSQDAFCRESAETYCPSGPITRSAEPVTSQALPPESVMPVAERTVTGYCSPVADPIATSVGGEVSVTVRVVLLRL